MNVMIADAGFPLPFVVGGLACVILGSLMSVAVLIIGVTWAVKRSKRDNSTVPPPESPSNSVRPAGEG